MKKLLLALTFVLMTVGSALATTVGFDELPMYSTDPKTGPLKFSAGDPTLYNDTMVADFLSSNAYLMSGRDDGTGLGRGTNGYFMTASLDNGALFNNVTLKLAAEEVLPGASVEFFYFFGKNDKSLWAGSTAYFSDTDYHTISLNNYGNYDFFGIQSLNFWNPDAEFSPFHIDDFSYTVQRDVDPVPEPSTIILLGIGLAGAAVWTRKRA